MSRSSRARLALLLTVACVEPAVGFEGSDAPRVEASFAVEGSLDVRPEVVAWAPRDGSPTAVLRVTDAATILTVVPGAGCLVLVRSSFVPVAIALELAPGSSRRLAPPSWKRGPVLTIDVRSDDDSPLPADVEARVRAASQWSRNEACVSALQATGFLAAVTDAAGIAHLGPLPPGSYALQAVARAHTRAERGVDVAPNAVSLTAVTFRLRPITTLTVAVDVRAIAEGPPFTVSLERENRQAVKASERWVKERGLEVTQPEGVTVEIPPGFYRLRLTKPGSQLAYAISADLPAGEQRLVLTPAPLTVRGAVTRADKPVPGASVTLRREGMEVVGTADDEGRYEVTAWFAADYGAFVQAPDGTVVLDHVDLRDLAAGDALTKDFELPSGTVSGTVVSAKDQAPIPAAKVTLIQSWVDRGAQSQLTATCDGDGRFTFAGVGVASQTRLEASARGFLPGGGDVDVGTGDAEHMIIRLDPSDRVTGIVLGPNGAPIAGATVACCAPALDGQFGQSVVTDGQGRFEIDATAATTLFAVAAAYAITWASARAEGETRMTLLPLSPPTTLRLEAQDGAAIPRVMVTFASRGGPALPFQLIFLAARLNGLAYMTDAEGLLPVSALPPGFYTVILRTAAGPVEVGTIGVPSPGVVTVGVASGH